MNESKSAGFNAADITALSHLYRGEMYRSTVWRTRLDATTNWAVATTGLALSLTFSSETASPLPLVLVGLLVAVFLLIEGRRYRFFDFFRIRAHILEVHFFGPILRGQGVRVDNGWNATLYQDYVAPGLHITFPRGRRSAAAAQLRLDLSHSGNVLYWQAFDPSNTDRVAQRVLCAGDDRPSAG